jgi:hypothetical protein
VTLPRSVADAVRASIKAAQQSGKLDKRWQVTVRVVPPVMSTDIVVTVVNTTDEFLFETVDGRRRYTGQARVLAGQVRALMVPAVAWAQEDRDTRFANLYFQDGYGAP